MNNGQVRFLVIGAGVNGSACATILHQSGIDVTILARGDRYQEILDNGIIIENPLNNQRTVAKVKVINSLNAGDLYDYIFVIIRKNQVLEFLPTLSQNCSRNIVFMGNTLADPVEYTDVLGKDRVMMGSVYAGGRREGKIIKAMVMKSYPTPFGELDGSITPRLQKLVSTLNRGISRAKISKHIVDDLIIHAAGVVPIALFGLKHGGDLRHLAGSTDDLYLMINAMRDSLNVVQSLGYDHFSGSDNFLRYSPRFILAALFRILLRSKYGEVGIGYHLSQAPDEMIHLANELKALVKKSGLAVPDLRKALGM